jgi:hypothetical protein
MAYLASHEMTYGVLHVLGAIRGERRRAELYVSKQDGKEYRETSFAASPGDLSPRHDHGIGGGYDSRCSCCYLNFSHTQEYHAAAIAGKPR